MPTSLALHENVDMFLDAAIRTSQYGSMENLAHYLYVEMPNFHKKDVKALARVTGIPAKAWRALRVDVRWRRIVAQLQTLDIIDYGQERQDIKAIHGIIHDEGAKDADKIRAFEVTERQKGTKVPERQEIEQTQRVEIVTRRIPDSESGYQPHTPYSAPKSRRQALGEVHGRFDVGAEDKSGRPALLASGDPGGIHKEPQGLGAYPGPFSVAGERGAGQVEASGATPGSTTDGSAAGGSLADGTE